MFTTKISLSEFLLKVALRIRIDLSRVQGNFFMTKRYILVYKIITIFKKEKILNISSLTFMKKFYAAREDFSSY
jgi:hypothetical protein